MDNLLIAPLSAGTLAAIRSLVDCTVRAEYRVEGADDERKGATILALAGVQMDLVRAYIDKYGNDTHLRGYSAHALRQQVTLGLQARLCQCAQLHPQGCEHYYLTGDRYCLGHWEEDVPEIDGAKLCGNCHVAEHQARNPLATAE